MTETFRVGEWIVSPDGGWLRPRRNLLRRRNYPDGRLMAVMRVLLSKRGELVRAEQILDAAWPGRVVTRDSVSTAIYELRRLLGDDAASPTYIRTEPRRGYRLIAAVEPIGNQSRTWSLIAALTTAGILAAAAAVWIVGDLTTDDQMPLRVVSLDNATHDTKLNPLTEAIDATLISALIRRNPDRIISNHDTSEDTLQLESLIVACDVGPTLVVRLLQTRNGHYVWSKSYSLDHESSNPSLVELVANDVTYALADI